MPVRCNCLFPFESHFVNESKSLCSFFEVELKRTPVSVRAAIYTIIIYRETIQVYADVSVINLHRRHSHVTIICCLDTKRYIKSGLFPPFGIYYGKFRRNFGTDQSRWTSFPRSQRCVTFSDKNGNLQRTFIMPRSVRRFSLNAGLHFTVLGFRNTRSQKCSESVDPITRHSPFTDRNRRLPALNATSRTHSDRQQCRFDAQFPSGKHASFPVRHIPVGV